MSLIQRFRPTGAAVVTSAVIGAIALAGCSAGQITQTSTQVPAVVGANANIGPVAVRDAQIEFSAEPQGANIYPVGGTAPLKMSIANSGGQPDRLVSASSPAAASIEITGTPDVPPGRVLLVGGEPEAAAGAAAPTASAPPGVTPSAAPPGAPPAGAPTDEETRSAEAARPAEAGSGAPTPSAEPVTPGDEIGGAGQEGGGTSPGTGFPAAPSGGDAGEAALGGAQVVLTGLKEDVRAGLTYPVVLNFERAGQVTLQVPVGFPEEPREDEPAE